MKNNQRGGIISSILFIPVGLALMVCFFALGYYVGKYQGKMPNQAEMPTPLPEIEPNKPSRQEDFTFYKTLSDKDDKTVSIDLKPKAVVTEKADDKRTIELKPNTVQPKQATPKQETPKKEPEASNAKVRYTLQIASYQEKDAAEADVKKMKQRGYSAFVVASQLEGKGTWYRVRIGSFLNKASAEKLQKELQTRAGVTPFITIE